MSEPVRLGEILPGVLQDIKRRCEQNPENKAFGQKANRHTERVRHAVRYFVSGKPNHTRETKRRMKWKAPL